MKIAAYLRANDSRTNDRVTHFGEALGARFSTRERPIECDLAIQAGFQISPAMKDAMERKVPLIILENPVWHYGDKSDTYVFGYNGLNNLGTGGYIGNRTSRPHPPLQPWKDPESGDKVVFGQLANDKAIRGHDHDKWVRESLAAYPEAEFRPHPVTLGAQELALQESIVDCLARTSLAITFNSTVGAEACIAGIPTLVAHEGGWAYPVAYGPDGPPDRSQWIRHLSWRHWTIGETIDVEYILSGYGRAQQDAIKGRYDNMSNGRAQP